jgi:hypothetical protein
MTRFARLLILIAGLFCAMSAQCWDGALSGTVTQVDVTGGSNYGIRVYLSTGVPMCTGSPNYWGYLNNTDSNYNAYVAAIMMAKATGSRLTLYLTNEGGFCHIGYLTLV